MAQENHEMFRLPRPIDWGLIQKSISYYKQIGYEYIEAPWQVSQEAMKVTFPNFHDSGVVGSAEQSFIQMIIDSSLKDGDYVACTPCFRKEKKYDNIRFPYFMKVELIIIGYADIKKCLNDAYGFFTYEALPTNLSVKENLESFDITLNEIEIGSYGTRKYKEQIWTYGTGLAEPRFSIARDM